MIIGFLGHVDHGKTSVIKALTGIDTDRLPDEKKRGITVDLGFSHISLKKSGIVGIIDVPGHEKYIKNMISGMCGMDAAVIVVDCNEAVREGTIEHINLLLLLNIRHVVVAMNKADLLTGEELGKRLAEVGDYMSERFGTAIPIVPVSALTGRGMDALTKSIDDMCAGIKAERGNTATDTEAAFMPIDRSFSVKGFGTVITGSLLSGEISMDKEYMIFPEKRSVRLRGIESYGNKTEKASAGHRLAINVKDIESREILRGQVLAEKNVYNPTSILDVRIYVPDYSVYEIQAGDKVKLYIGSGEYIAKVYPMENGAILKGESRYAQLRLEKSMVSYNGERFILRSIAPLATVGGGYVIDSFPSKKKPYREENIQSFRIKEFGSPKDRIYELIRDSAYLKLIDDRYSNELDELLKEGRILKLYKYYITKEKEKKLYESVIGYLTRFHNDNKRMKGAPSASVKSSLNGINDSKAAGELIDYWLYKGLLKDNDGFISLKDFSMDIPKDNFELRERILEEYKERAMNVPALNELKVWFSGNGDLYTEIEKLISDGLLIRLDERYLMYKETFLFATEKLRLLSIHSENGNIILGEYRDRIKSSRKVALALLEYFDRNGITCKVGDVRKLL